MSTLAHNTDNTAARLLWTCRTSGTFTDALPPELRPNDPATGHAIQASLPEVAGPLAGRILESFVDPLGVCAAEPGSS